MGFTSSVYGYEPFLNTLQDFGEGTTNFIKNNPYAAASMATMPFPLLSGALGMKASYDQFSDDPSSRTPLNYGLASLDTLPYAGLGVRLGKSAAMGNLLDDAGEFIQGAKDTASDIYSGARNLFDLNNYNTPNAGLLSNNVNAMPPIKPDPSTAEKNYLGMFVGKKDPRFKPSSQIAGDAFNAGKSDAEIFKESGIVRQPQGEFKGGSDLENALEVTDDYTFNPYLIKKYRDKIKNNEFLTEEKVDLKYFVLGNMAGRKGITADRSEITNSRIYQEYKDLPTLKDLFQGKDINDLLKAYPEMGNTKIDLNLDPSAHNVNGGFYRFASKNQDLFSPTIQINARTPEDAIQAIKHEMQHNIQAIENWTQGGSPKSIRYIQERLRKNIQRLPESSIVDIDTLGLAYRNLERKIRKAPRYSDKYEQEFFDIINPIRNRYKSTQLFDRVNEFSKIEAGLGSANEVTRDKAALEAYFRFGGEVQARATQYRSGMSMLDRLNTNPYFVPPEGRHFLTGEPRAVAGKQLERLLFGRDKKVRSNEHGSPDLGSFTDVEALGQPRIQYPDSHIID